MTHICVSELTIIGSDNGLSPGRRQATIWNNTGLLLIEPLRTNFSEISIGIQTFSFKKMHLNMSSAKWRPFCLGLNVLMFHIYIFSDGYIALGICYLKAICICELPTVSFFFRKTIIYNDDNSHPHITTGTYVRHTCMSDFQITNEWGLKSEFSNSFESWQPFRLLCCRKLTKHVRLWDIYLKLCVCCGVYCIELCIRYAVYHMKLRTCYGIYCIKLA